ncbi:MULTISPECIES: hypothetical protein [Streptomyces]|uniref:hypothetical protein n=1 Tax=Streptomyces TaxID=1883 RepID=UPI0002FB5C23|nr:MULTISPECIES: hypothetical protein [Streptomyces]
MASMESPLRRWWTTAAAVTVALIGALLLAGQVKHVWDGHAELAALRAHGLHSRAQASLTTSCTQGRGISCQTSSVWLDFIDADGDSVSVPEEAIDGSLYVPHGHRDAEDRVATTVVYDRANPYEAQPAGALDQSVLDLAAHRWIAWTIALALLGGGTAGAIAAWPPRPTPRRPA